MTTVELVAPIATAVLNLRKDRKARFVTKTVDRALDQLSAIVRIYTNVPNDRFTLRMRLETIEAILMVCGDCADQARRVVCDVRASL